MIKHSEEFKQEAVRIALTSGLPRGRVASDSGGGKSTLNKWVCITARRTWWQRRKQIWRERMNGFALRTAAAVADESHKA